MRLVALVPMLAVCACHARHDVTKVSADAKVKLQRQLNGNYGVNRVTARTVELIATTPRRYEGSATVAVDGANVVLPLAVMSDGKTTIVTSDDAKIGSVIEQHAADLAGITGERGRPASAARVTPPPPIVAAAPAPNAPAPAEAAEARWPARASDARWRG